MPSVNSSSSPMVWASSTVMTPSLPTLSKASAISSPIFGSWAEIAATCATSDWSSTSRAISSNLSLTASTAASMPRLRAIGCAPAATLRMRRRGVSSALLLDDCEDVARGQDEVLVRAVLGLGAAVLGEDDGVTLLDVQREPLAVLEPAGADGENGALLGLLFRGVRDND